MVSEKVLNRIRDCHKLIEGGTSKRKAYLQAHVDQDTYNKYLPLILEDYNATNIVLDGIKIPKNIFKETNTNIPVTKKGKGRPRKYDMKKQRLCIFLDPKIIEKIDEEAKEKGLDRGPHAASCIVETYNKRYPELKAIK